MCVCVFFHIFQGPTWDIRVHLFNNGGPRPYVSRFSCCLKRRCISPTRQCTLPLGPAPNVPPAPGPTPSYIKVKLGQSHFWQASIEELPQRVIGSGENPCHLRERIVHLSEDSSWCSTGPWLVRAPACESSGGHPVSTALSKLALSNPPCGKARWAQQESIVRGEWWIQRHVLIGS